MNKVILLCMILMAAQTIHAEKIMVIDLEVYKNDSVHEKSLKIIEGRPSFYTIPGDYSLVALDDKGEMLANESIGLRFLMYTDPATEMNYSLISQKMLYNESMKEIRLYRKNTLIYSSPINCCVINGICEPHETHLSCPQDCPIDKKDGVCTPNKEGRCDPDCMEGADPNCAGGSTPPAQIATAQIQDTGFSSYLFGVILVAAIIAVVLLVVRSET